MSPGKTTIAPDVIMSIARLTTLNVDGVSRMCLEPTRVSRLFHRGFHDGVRVEVEDDTVFVDLNVIIKGEVNIREVSRNIQQQVSRALSDMVGMQVGQVNIFIEDIDYPEESEA